MTTTTAPAPTASTSSRRSGPNQVSMAAARNGMINVVLPTGVYYIAQPILHSAPLALAAAGAVPVVRVVRALARRAPVEPLAVLSGAAYLVALAVYGILGSALALELHDPIVIGGVGMALLVALVAGMSADGLLRRIAGDSLPVGHVTPGEGRRTTVTMAIVAGTLVTHAAVSVVIALSVSVSSFQLDSTIAGIATSALGALAAVTYRRRTAAAR